MWPTDSFKFGTAAKNDGNDEGDVIIRRGALDCEAIWTGRPDYSKRSIIKAHPFPGVFHMELLSHQPAMERMLQLSFDPPLPLTSTLAPQHPKENVKMFT